MVWLITRVLLLFFIIGSCKCDQYVSAPQYVVPLLDLLSPEAIIAANGDFPIAAILINTGSRLMMDLFNNGVCDFSGMLNDTKIVYINIPTFNIAPVVIQQTIAFAEQGISLLTGLSTSVQSEAASHVGTVYDVATLSSFAPDSFLGDKKTFPYFSRVAPAVSEFVRVQLAGFVYFRDIGGIGWSDIAIIVEVSQYGIDFAQNYIEQGGELQPPINVVQYRTMLPGSDYRVELQTVKQSGARVIIADTFLINFHEFMETANEEGLVGEHYVWFVSPVVVANFFSSSEPSPLSRGMLTSLLPYPESNPLFDCFANAWKVADPVLYPGAGLGQLPPIPALTGSDLVVATIAALDQIDKMQMLDGRRISGQLWADAIRNISVPAVNQQMEFFPNGDRKAQLSLFYYSPESNSFVRFADSEFNDYTLQNVQDVVWYSNTTQLPDLDIRPPFSYWSCEDGKMKEDPTGKTVSLHTPGSSHVDEIESGYYCDHFIDCHNLSDESSECGGNYMILFIVFGVITGLLMILTLLIIIFVAIFGIILQYRRLKSASPFFLMLLLISIFVGYSSVFAFFGKPHPVACAFQPWLLGLPVISMIAILAVKNLRIYRIFKYPLKRTKITDLELLAVWTVILVPAVLIIVVWMIVSTPTASIKERDGEDHYICATGGFTGEPGGIIFFFIFVGYSAGILIFGAIISVLSRNVPSLFNESKLLTISIYNLGFLSAVIIPVFLVIQPFNPFWAWILRTCAVLYAFTATLVLQFFPRIVGIVFVDRFKDNNKSSTSYISTKTHE